MNEAFLEDIGPTWTEQGFNSQSESLRYVARTAVKYPEFTREGRTQTAASEHNLRVGETE